MRHVKLVATLLALIIAAAPAAGQNKPPEIVEVVFVRLGERVNLQMKGLPDFGRIGAWSNLSVIQPMNLTTAPLCLEVLAKSYGACRVTVLDSQGRSEVFLVIVETPELPGGPGR